MKIYLVCEHRVVMRHKRIVDEAKVVLAYSKKDIAEKVIKTNNMLSDPSSMYYLEETELEDYD